MKPVTVYLPDRSADYIAEMADRCGVSKSEITRWLFPVFFWDHTTGKPVPPGAEADRFPDYDRSVRKALAQGKF